MATTKKVIKKTATKKPVKRARRDVPLKEPEAPKARVVTIDLNIWCTPKQKADMMQAKDGKTGVSKPYISKLIKEGKLEVMDIPELGLKLVKK